MLPIRFPALLLIVAVPFCTAQKPQLDNALITARGAYYTPTAAGLAGFSCNVKTDWRALITRIRHTEVSDSDPLFQYVTSARLSVDDDLRAGGSLDWATNDLPKPEAEAAADRTRSGLKQMVHGFFQSWNAYMNGGMIPVPDATTVITAEGAGYHLHGSSAIYTLDESFDKDWVLTAAHVTSTSFDITASPTFDRSPSGLIVTSVGNIVHQPPTAPAIRVTMRVTYASVDGFQLPSHLQVNEENVGIFDFDFTGCHARVFDANQVTGGHQ